MSGEGTETTRVEVAGSVERVTYYNEENGYSVIRVKPDSRQMLPFPYATGRDGLVTAVGTLPELNPGEWVKLWGEWRTHPRHGRQFVVELCQQSVPASLTGMKRYLGSGLIRGVGRVMAERIVDHFGEETLTVIDETPERLTEVQGIGRKRITGIKQAWQEQRSIKEVMLFLQTHGISTSLATKIYKQYEDEALAVVQTTPYRLVKDIYGIGFKTADKIARALGLAEDDPNRIEAGVAYLLNQKAGEGHVYVPQAELEPEAAEILAVETEKVTAVIDALETGDFLKRETITYEITGGSEVEVAEERAVYLLPFYFSEIGLSKRLQSLVNHPTSRLAQVLPRWRRLGTQVLGGIALSDQQLGAVETAVTNKVTILTGGPGTGKTTTLQALLTVLDKCGYRYLLAAPTGRAAKRMTEATGKEAKTVHRLLGFQPGTGFAWGEERPLETDMVIVDEASMLDLLLTYNLLKAISPDTHLLLVGDVDQLPSVGAGDVLRDIIAAGVAAVVRLETIFRQAANSLIIHNAHRINQGLMPEIRSDAQDFFLFVKQDPEELAALLLDVVAKRIPHKFGFNPLTEVQVLSPMYAGRVGVAQLNTDLQEKLNPPGKRKAERRLGGRILRVGDKLMQTTNNYDKNVFNGDIGYLTGIDLVGQTLTVNVDGDSVVYSFLEADELVHAYAVTVHKSQGAEYPCVVMPVVTQHYMMLQRNLLYTAVTRAKKVVILVGTRRALAIAVKNHQVGTRYTALDWRLGARREGGIAH
ncbi:MAG TPA: ATP-dependent RecD-like DNA helicase [Anaerolineae bacterium]|nr:ATP-dependent RecD-like DNA helicase [Anaerolineae bacterium]